MNSGYYNESQPAVVEGQIVEFKLESIYGKKGTKALVTKTDTVFKKKLIYLNDKGGKTDGSVELYNTQLNALVKIVAESEIEYEEGDVEAPIAEVDYRTEEEVEAKIKALLNYEYDTVKGLSQIELKQLISMQSGFHPKYIKDIKIQQWVTGSDVYEIHFRVDNFTWDLGMLIYEEGVFDLDFK